MVLDLTDNSNVKTDSEKLHDIAGNFIANIRLGAMQLQVSQSRSRSILLDDPVFELETIRAAIDLRYGAGTCVKADEIDALTTTLLEKVIIEKPKETENE